MAKRSFNTLRIRLSQNLQSRIFVTSKSAMCQKGNLLWHKGSVGIYSKWQDCVYGFKPYPTPPLILY